MILNNARSRARARASTPTIPERQLILNRRLEIRWSWEVSDAAFTFFRVQFTANHRDRHSQLQCKRLIRSLPLVLVLFGFCLSSEVSNVSFPNETESGRCTVHLNQLTWRAQINLSSPISQTTHLLTRSERRVTISSNYSQLFVIDFRANRLQLRVKLS